MQARLDIILKGGNVCDPAAGLNGTLDIGISEGRVVVVERGLDASLASEVIDVSGKLVLPGLIDVHAHIFQHVNGAFGLDADDVGVRSGVTTVIEQGGVSYATMPAFRRYIVETKATRVLAFPSVFLAGGVGDFYYPAQFRPDTIIVPDAIQCAKDNPDLMRGLKFHAEGRGFSLWGSEPLRKAVEIADAAGLPIYVHLGQMWRPTTPEEDTVENEAILGELLELLRLGDTIAHCFTAERGTYTFGGAMHPQYERAIMRGIKTDVGYGMGFSFDLARIGYAAGLVPDTAGADLHGSSARAPASTGTRFRPDRYPAFQPRHSLVGGMNALLAVGYRLDQVVPMVTSNAATLAGMQGTIGTLAPGACADVTILEDEAGDWLMKDPRGGEARLNRLLRPLFCLRHGARYDCDPSFQPQPIDIHVALSAAV